MSSSYLNLISKDGFSFYIEKRVGELATFLKNKINSKFFALKR